jgi:hypothetical protein
VQFEGTSEISTAKESFTAFVGDAGCTQPHHQVQKKVDNFVLPLILLPMNTTKVDVFYFVNEEVNTLVGGESMSLVSFHRLWRAEFPHVQIPRFSRFSKCYHCWEYKCGMEATTNAAADKGALPCAYPTSDGGEMRLLVVQEVNHDNPRLLYVFDCGWYGPEHDHGPEDEADCEEH